MNQEKSNSAQKIGVEIADDSIIAVSLDLTAGTVVDRHSAALVPGDELEQVVAFIAGLKDNFGDFERLGVAVPGLVEGGTGRIAYSAVVPSLSSVDLAGAIRSGAGVTAVVDNDANAAAFGEYRIGAGRGSSSMFYATIGTGVGGAFIAHGDLWRGANGFAGEFGYMTINSEGLRLEDVASSANIVRRTINRFNRDSTSSLGSLPESAIRVHHIVSAAEEGDDFAQLMIERTGAFVGTALASVINLLNIETVVLGGEMMKAGEMILVPIIEKAKELSFGPSFKKTSIVTGRLDSPAAVGAALLASEA